MADPHPPAKALELTCPTCRQAWSGEPSHCSACGADLRGLAATGDTLSPTPRPASSGDTLSPDSRRAPSGTGPVIGSVVDKRYRILGRLGEGGMGAVYRVEHVRMGKVMALKVLHPEAALDRAALRRFHQEARIVSRLTHPNTVSVFDFGEISDGTLFMAMEYVPGRDLASLLAESGPLPERRAVLIAMQVLRSLAEAHDAGVVHRDIKPANVMQLKTREGEDFVKVVDFGIAKLLQAARGDRRLATGGADFVGTPNYMSPEQVAGESLDGRSDIYSVGAMLFELLTGCCLFEGDTPLAIAAKHLTAKPPRIDQFAPGLGITPSLADAIERALAKKSRDRFQSADQMRAALAAAIAPTGSPATTGDLKAAQALPPPGEAIAGRDDWDAFEKSLRWRRRSAPLLALAAVTLAGALVFNLVRPRPPPPRLPATAEVEPNEGPRTATLIAAGTRVEGFIKRTARDQGDRDLFEFEVSGKDPVLARVRVTGVPNVNLSLDLFGNGASLGGDERTELPNLGHVDDQFLGGAEELSDLRLPPGRYFVRVSDKRRAGEGPGAPRENSYDPYFLTVTLSPLPRFFESEPNNSLDEAMRLSAARPVFGHAGARPEATLVQTSGGAAAIGAAWTDDYYEQVLPTGATTGCALLRGVTGATLTLATVGVDLGRVRAIAAQTDREKALADHLGRFLREKPARIGAAEVQARCSRAQETITFRVQVAEGASEQPYMLAVVDDSEDGFSGVLSACDQLVATGEAPTCKWLLSAALRALPISRSAERARAYLGKIP